MKIKLILFTLISFNLFTFGQNKNELEKSKLKNIQDIKQATELLKTTQSSRSKTVNELRIINKRIDLRKDLIKDIENQITVIEGQIIEKEEVIESLSNDLEQKKKEYEELIILAYKNKNAYNSLMFVLAAEDINKAYKRYKYLKRLTDYRKKQAELIQEIKIVQEKKLLELTIVKQDKEVLLLQRKEEFANLNYEQNEKNFLVSQLSKKEKELKKELKEKEQILNSIEEQIRKIIEEEARRSGTMYSRLTPKEKIISSEFEKNKGNLPWPTYRGIVTSKFGLQNHPVLKGIKTNNNGIDITSVKNSEVKAIFNGEVSLIAAIPGGNYAIIIRHGNYFTVYQNIVKVKVKQGDKISTNQNIGTIYSSGDDNTAVLHFEIRKEFEKLNPEEWLAN